MKQPRWKAQAAKSDTSSASDRSVPFNRPALSGKELDYIRDAINRGQLSGDGHYTARCSEQLESLTGGRKTLLTHSCTAALEMAAILSDLGPGDEVVMPSFTFVSTANAVVMRGATPVFVDIDARNLNIDPDRVEDSITNKTKAIFAVHYAGVPADMDRLRHIAAKHGCFLVEDAAQALGSKYKGRECGSLGDMAAISFHETKNIISGEGGALVINRPDLIERAEVIREKGTNRSRFHRGEVDKYTWVDIGSSFLPGELVAAFLLSQLESVDAINAKRLSYCETYRQGLKLLESSGLARLPSVSTEYQGNGHMFYLLMRDAETQESFIRHMKSHGIQAPFHYVPLHSSPAGIRYGRVGGDLSNTNQISSTLVRLPLHLNIEKDLDRVIRVATSFTLESGFV